MIPAAPLIRVPHFTLQVARPGITDEAVLIRASLRPRVVLGPTEVYLVELLSPFFPEQLVIELPRAIFAPKEQPEGVFRIPGPTGESTPDPKPTTDLKTILISIRVNPARRMNKLKGGFSLPGITTASWIGVDASA